MLSKLQMGESVVRALKMRKECLQYVNRETLVVLCVRVCVCVCVCVWIGDSSLVLCLIAGRIVGAIRGGIQAKTCKEGT